MIEHLSSSPHSRFPRRLWPIAGFFLVAAVYCFATLLIETFGASSLTVAGALNYPLFGFLFAWIAYQILRGVPQGRETALNFAQIGIVGTPLIAICLFGIGFFVDGPPFERLAPGIGVDPYSTGGSVLCVGLVLGIVWASRWTRRVLKREDVKAYFRS